MTLTPIPVSALLRRVTLLTILLSLAYGAYSASHTAPGVIDSDFKIFRRVAEITRDGRLAEVYDLDRSEALQARYPVDHTVVPYTYPPLTTLAIRPLADLPAWAGYLAWMLPGLLAFGFALVRLAGPHAAALGVASASGIILNISVGQNGLLIAGLTGLASLALVSGHRASGLAAAGCLALKPHLAIGIPLALLAQRRWAQTLALAVIGAGLTALGFLAYGPEVARAWLAGGRQASEHLALGLAGAYPMERMVSVYATLRTYGVPAGIAFAAHGVVLALALATTFQASRDARPARVLGLALIASLFISPYLYDYDLALVPMALALLVRDGVFDRAPRAHIAALTLIGLLPIPGAFSNWGLLGGHKIAVGAPGLIAILVLTLQAASTPRRKIPDQAALAA